MTTAVDNIILRPARESDMPAVERIITHYILNTVGGA